MALMLLQVMPSGLVLLAQTSCPTPVDSNSDGLIGITDLIALLALYGDADQDLDNVWDSQDLCIDENACNYLSNPTVPCAFLDATGVCGGWCQDDADNNGVCDWICGIDSILHQGKWYRSIQIGNQCWMRDNLQARLYTNLDSIPYNILDAVWSTTTSGACTQYEYGVTNNPRRGLLYNLYAVLDDRGLCPSGWHVPSDAEFIELEAYIGLPVDDWYDEGVRGATENIGTKLKDNQGWSGTNQTLFSAVPTGWRKTDGNFYNETTATLFWTSTLTGSSAYGRSLTSVGYNGGGQEPGIGRLGGGWYNFFGLGLSNHPRYGMAVRCIRNTP